MGAGLKASVLCWKPTGSAPCIWRKASLCYIIAGGEDKPGVDRQSARNGCKIRTTRLFAASIRRPLESRLSRMKKYLLLGCALIAIFFGSLPAARAASGQATGSAHLSGGGGGHGSAGGGHGFAGRGFAGRGGAFHGQHGQW